jgi:hypothetical protein
VPGSPAFISGNPAELEGNGEPVNPVKKVSLKSRQEDVDATLRSRREPWTINGGEKII